MPAGRRRPQATWWGYHRLTDDWARRLVTAAAIPRGDLVLDVGAGTGEITAPLVAAGAHVLAVELHARRADALAHRFRGAPVRVLRVDAHDLRLPQRPFRVVANPPFAVTTALVRRVFATEVVAQVPRRAFRPSPPTGAVVLRLERRTLPSSPTSSE